MKHRDYYRTRLANAMAKLMNDEAALFDGLAPFYSSWTHINVSENHPVLGLTITTEAGTWLCELAIYEDGTLERIKREEYIFDESA